MAAPSCTLSVEKRAGNVTEYKLRENVNASARASIYRTCIAACLIVIIYQVLYCNWTFGGPICFVVVMGGVVAVLAKWAVVIEESLLILPDLGVQLQTRYSNGHKIVKFLDKRKVKAVVINEGITFSRVIYYLAFVVEGRQRMVLAFENLTGYARVRDLEPVYRAARSALHLPPEGASSSTAAACLFQPSASASSSAY